MTGIHFRIDQRYPDDMLETDPTPESRRIGSGWLRSPWAVVDIAMLFAAPDRNSCGDDQWFEL